MDTAELGAKLRALCRTEGNQFAEIKALLESLSEDLLREVVRSEGTVSESQTEL